MALIEPKSSTSAAASGPQKEEANFAAGIIKEEGGNRVIGPKIPQAEQALLEWSHLNYFIPQKQPS